MFCCSSDSPRAHLSHVPFRELRFVEKKYLYTKLSDQARTSITHKEQCNTFSQRRSTERERVSAWVNVSEWYLFVSAVRWVVIKENASEEERPETQHTDDKRRGGTKINQVATTRERRKTWNEIRKWPKRKTERHHRETAKSCRFICFSSMYSN